MQFKFINIIYLFFREIEIKKKCISSMINPKIKKLCKDKKPFKFV